MAEVVAETSRLRLRDWDEGDRAAFYSAMNTEPVMRHLGGVQTSTQWAEAHERIAGCARDHGHCLWIIEEGATREILGFCGLKRVNSPGTHRLAGQMEIGWRLRQSAWGRGIAKEAAIASLDLAFGRFAAPHVVAMTVAGNLPSQGLMARLGMVRRADLDFIDPRFGPDLNPWLIWRIDARGWAVARAAALR